MRFLFLRQVRESFHLVVTKSREQQKTPVDSELREKQTRSGRILVRFLGCIVGQFSLEVGTTTPATAWNIGVPSASVSPGFANDLRQGCPAKPCRHRTAPWSCFNPALTHSPTSPTRRVSLQKATYLHPEASLGV